MRFRYDLAQRQFKKIGKSYGCIAKASVVYGPNGRPVRTKDGTLACLSASTVWDICSGKGNPGDPNVSTITALFKALGLKPEYALNFQLKTREFHLAVANGKAG